MREARWEIFKDKKGQFRFRLRSANNQIMLQSEAYTRRSSAIRAIDRIEHVIEEISWTDIRFFP